MTHSRTPDALADLRARLAAQEARIAAQEARIALLSRRRRVPRRALPVLLAALLVALVPLATLAATPFTDLNPGSVHNADIDLIYNAGITRGCDPDVAYCPNGTVTREQMASFLARTAGLGDNPPVANALTAQRAATAQRAVTAQTANTAQEAQNAAQLGGQPASAYQLADRPIASATNAQQATNAAALGGQPPSYYQPAGQAIANATSAQNATTVGGYPASALNRVAFSGRNQPLTFTLPNDNTLVDVVRVAITVPGDAPQAVVVRGQVNAYNQATSGGYVYANLVADSGESSYGTYNPYQTTDPFAGITVAVQWTFVAAPGERTYTLRLRGAGTPGPLALGSFALIATTHPFGATGTAGAADLPAAPTTDGRR